MLFHSHQFIANVLPKMNHLISSALRNESWQATGCSIFTWNGIYEMEIEHKWKAYFEKENIAVIKM